MDVHTRRQFLGRARRRKAERLSAEFGVQLFRKRREEAQTGNLTLLMQSDFLTEIRCQPADGFSTQMIFSSLQNRIDAHATLIQVLDGF